MNAFAHWFTAGNAAKKRHAALNPFAPHTEKYHQREQLIRDAESFEGMKIGCLFIRALDHIDTNAKPRHSTVVMRCDCECGRKNVFITLASLKQAQPKSCGKDHIKEIQNVEKVRNN